jgi:hypothetical protein
MNTVNARYRIAVLPLLVILLAACAAPAPATSAPAPAPTALPPTAAPAATAAQATDKAPAPTTAPTAVAGGSAAAGSVTYELVAANSEASYAIREQLARNDFPNDAVGKTQAVSGSVTVKPDGTIDSANSKFVVDATTITSD